MFPKFTALNIIPTEFNHIVSPLESMRHKKSDSGNGYFIVADTWGTVFFRETTTKDFIQIVDHEDKTRRTYTKIPTRIKHNVFFLYINYKSDRGFVVNMPKASRVIGMQTPNHSVVGGWANTTLLVYSPTGEAPAVEETETEMLCPLFVRKPGEEDFQPFCWSDLMRGKPVRYIYTNPEGFCITQYNRQEA